MHDADVCGQCQYVGDRSFIHVPQAVQQGVEMSLGRLLKVGLGLAEREDFVVELGRFTLPQWSGHAMWYLFECPECLAVQRDYLHGHRLYVLCRECGSKWNLRQERFYREAGVPAPPTEWKTLRELWRRRRLFRKSPATLSPASKP